MKNLVKIMENGKEVGMVILPEKTSQYWEEVKASGKLELEGALLTLTDEVIYYEGCASCGFIEDGCPQSECDIPSCQWCALRTVTYSDRIYLPKGSECYIRPEMEA